MVPPPKSIGSSPAGSEEDWYKVPRHQVEVNRTSVISQSSTTDGLPGSRSGSRNTLDHYDVPPQHTVMVGGAHSSSSLNNIVPAVGHITLDDSYSVPPPGPPQPVNLDGAPPRPPKKPTAQLQYVNLDAVPPTQKVDHATAYPGYDSPRPHYDVPSPSPREIASANVPPPRPAKPKKMSTGCHEESEVLLSTSEPRGAVYSNDQQSYLNMSSGATLPTAGVPVTDEQGKNGNVQSSIPATPPPVHRELNPKRKKSEGKYAFMC